MREKERGRDYERESDRGKREREGERARDCVERGVEEEREGAGEVSRTWFRGEGPCVARCSFNTPTQTRAKKIYGSQAVS